MYGSHQWDVVGGGVCVCEWGMCVGCVCVFVGCVCVWGCVCSMCVAATAGTPDSGEIADLPHVCNYLR